MNKVFGKLVAVAASSLVVGVLSTAPASAGISSSGAATIETGKVCVRIVAQRLVKKGIERRYSNSRQ